MKKFGCTNKVSMRKIFNKISGVMLGLFMLMLSACAHYPVNPKLESMDAEAAEESLCKKVYDAFRDKADDYGLDVPDEGPAH